MIVCGGRCVVGGPLLYVYVGRCGRLEAGGECEARHEERGINEWCVSWSVMVWLCDEGRKCVGQSGRVAQW